MPAQFVAPDGAKYAYTDAQSQIHVVTIAGGADRVITTSGTWGLYGYTVNGVYAGRPDPAGTGLTGLWVFGPDGGSTVQLVDNGTWLLVGNDAAWSLASVGPAPTGANVLGNAVGTKLVKLNLATGQQQAWYLSTNGNVGMAALDRLGRPVLVDVDNGSVLVVTAQDSASTVFSGGLPLSVMADAHGIWIGHPFTLSIYLSSDGSSASRWGQYGYNGTIQFAGGCG